MCRHLGAHVHSYYKYVLLILSNPLKCCRRCNFKYIIIIIKDSHYVQMKLSFLLSFVFQVKKRKERKNERLCNKYDNNVGQALNIAVVLLDTYKFYWVEQNYYLTYFCRNLYCRKINKELILCRQIECMDVPFLTEHKTREWVE